METNNDLLSDIVGVDRLTYTNNQLLIMWRDSLLS